MSYNLHRCQISLKTWPDPASLLPWYQNSFEDKTSQELQQPHKKESSPQTYNGSYCQCQFQCQHQRLFFFTFLCLSVFLPFYPPIDKNQWNVATILLLGVVCQKLCDANNINHIQCLNTTTWCCFQIWLCMLKKKV